MPHQKFKRGYIHCLFFLSIIIVTISCERVKEVEDPCEYCCPKATGINKVIFKKTNSDTLQHLNFEVVNEPCYSMAYFDFYDSKKTNLEIRYNAHYPYDDPDHFQTEPLFNGAISFEISLTMMDSTLSNQYKVDRLKINFENGYYAGYESVYDTNTKINISKYGGVWDKIEGSFTSTFINYNNVADTLIIDCQFSADRWCDI